MKLAALLALLLAACDDPSDIAISVTSPSGSAELVPDGEIDFEWTLIGGPAEVVITAIPIDGDTGPVLFDQTVPDGPTSFPWQGVDVQAQKLPPNVYDVSIDVVVDGTSVDGASRSIMVHGIYFTDPAPGETVTANGSYDVRVTTVSLRPLDLTFKLGDTEFETRSIGGEFVPFDRTVTLSTGPVAGTYTVSVDADDGDALMYNVDGGMIDWTP